MSGAEIADVVVIGGGMNGLAAALALGGPGARRPLKVTLIDTADPAQTRQAAFDGRASAITASSRRFFTALGVWDRLAPDAEPMREIIVTDARPGVTARPALLHFAAEDQPGGQVSAYMIENRIITTVLQEAAAAAPAITLIAPARVQEFSAGPGLARLTLSDGRSIAARLVVAADGRNSPARQQAGIAVTGWSYGQSGIVTTVAHELPHGGRAEEHFLPAGPFAILPLTGQRASLVWTEARAEADRLVALADDAFLAALKSRFGDHLGEVRLAGPRHAWPLSLQIARDFIAPRLALIGDAAHVVHPIAGLGLNLGLKDVAALAEAVADAAAIGLDPGSDAVLQRYQSWRRLDTVMVAAATDGLNRLFSNDNGFLRFLRDAGLAAVDQLRPLKSLFMREAAGMSGELPKLMRGEPV